MAYVEIHGRVRFHCGGSVLNRRFVLTAAHCACDALPCAVNRRDEINVNFDPNGKLFVYVGITDVADKTKNPNNLYKVVEVKVHEKYRRDFHDLALLGVDRDFAFSAVVRPICLPPGPAFSDGGGWALVAGWGHISNRACHTGHQGPAPFSQCLFPFRWQNQSHSSCARIPTPSASNAPCRRLPAQANKPGQTIASRTDVVDVDSGSRVTACFPLTAGSHGWCATCRINATQGDPRHCGKTGREAAASLPTPTTDADWGLCKPSCGRSGVAATSAVLREVRLSIFDIAVCSDILSRVNSSYNLEMELCAGSINSRRVLKVRGRRGRDGAWHPSVAQSEEAPLEQFIGGQDSCLGDSGGPLWKVTEDGRFAILVGVVSRGVNCANHDAPGIYARVKTYLKWIRANAANGECNRLLPGGRDRFDLLKTDRKSDTLDSVSLESSSGDAKEIIRTILDDDDERNGQGSDELNSLIDSILETKS